MLLVVVLLLRAGQQRASGAISHHVSGGRWIWAHHTCRRRRRNSTTSQRARARNLFGLARCGGGGAALPFPVLILLEKSPALSGSRLSSILLNL